jgi:hypothetical protein
MRNYALQKGPCSFLNLRISPWGVPFPFLLCSFSLSALSSPWRFLFPWPAAPLSRGFPPASFPLLHPARPCTGRRPGVDLRGAVLERGRLVALRLRLGAAGGGRQQACGARARAVQALGRRAAREQAWRRVGVSRRGGGSGGAGAWARERGRCVGAARACARRRTGAGGARRGGAAGVGSDAGASGTQRA